jgi:hypothetical protein
VPHARAPPHLPGEGQSQPGKRVLGIADAQDIDHNGRKIPAA